MDERSKWTPEQLEILETLRCEGDTEGDPALAALQQDPDLVHRLAQIREWDGRISDVIHDVAVPTGLAEQILEKLDPSDERPIRAATLPRPKSRSRRWLAVTGVGLAIVLLIVGVLGQSLPKITPETLRSIARDRFVESQGNEPAGLAVRENNGSDRFPYSRDVVDIPGKLWRSIPSFRRAKAEAYDLPLGPSQKATLYVVRCRSDGLPQRPPRQPQLQTQGLAITAWQADGFAYVVVVEGREGVSAEATYRLLLKSMSQQLT